MSKMTVRSWRDISKLALGTRNKYVKLEKKRYGRSWTKEEIAQGLVSDVGDLMKEIMKQADIREGKNRENLIHELCDCLWSILVLADKYEVDLEKEFPRSMIKLTKKINQALK